MALKSLVGEKLLNEVIRYERKKKEWRVLVVDKMGMRMVSSCTKMHELCEGGVTLVEDITKIREPLQTLEAVYLLSPTELNIRTLIQDFAERPLYKGAHVYFNEAIPDALFEMLKRQKVVKYMKTCQELNLAFVPFEEKVFSLDAPRIFASLYSPRLENTKADAMERMAEQVATVCAALGEFPSIRVRDGWEDNMELAQLVLKRLTAYRENNPEMGQGPEKALSTLLILDRGFDCVSPLLHEFTYQAMAYDLLPIANDVYKYSNQGKEREVLLDENDDLWCKLRHSHIAEVSKLITDDFKKFQSANKGSTVEGASMRDLSQMIKKMPQHQKELSKYSKHMHLAEDCMKNYKGYIDRLCKAEQDLAMGSNADGEVIKDHIKNIVEVLLDMEISHHDRARIIALYIMVKNGIAEDNFNKLADHGQIEQVHREMILNMAHLGINIISQKKPTFNYPRRDRTSVKKYTTSRWTPIVKDIMEDFMEEKLSKKLFPFLVDHSKGASVADHQAAQSTRYGKWRQDKAQQTLRKVPRLIIFIAGGMTYSEMRAAYEVTSINNKWDVFVGSSHILTPEQYLNDLAAISKET